MPVFAYLILAFTIGCAIPLQAAINNQLKVHLDGSTLLASLVSFLVGTLALGHGLAISQRVRSRPPR